MNIGKQKETVWNGRHIEVERLAEGVFASISRIGGAAVSNSAIIDLGDRTVVFDSSFLPVAAQEIKTAAEELTKRSVSILINSHSHYDHFWGNQAFSAETLIVSSTGTRELIQKNGQATLDRHKSNIDTAVNQAKKEYDSAENELDKTQALVWLGQYNAFKSEHENLRIRMPDAAFSDTLEIHGNQRSVKLISYTHGHSDDDCVLYIPTEGIVFTGDLLFIGYHAYLAAGDSESWKEALSDVQTLDFTVAVPGHGPVGIADDLEEMKAYIDRLHEFVSQLVAAGVPKDKLVEQPVVSPYENWLYRRFYYVSLNYLYDLYSGKAGS